MENESRSVRRWGPLVAALLLCLPLIAQPGEPPQNRATEGEPQWFAQDFGVIGEPGSYRVGFYNYGGSVFSVRLLDELAEADLRGKDPMESEDYYQLVKMVQAGYASFVLEEQGSRRLPVPIDTALWIAERGAGLVRFTLDCGNGLTLEKTFRHETGRRDFELEIALRRSAAYDGKANELKLQLRGAALANPKREHILGQNPAVAFGRAVNSETGEEQTWVERCDGNPNLAQLPNVGASSGRSYIDFAGTTNRFFGAFLVPNNEPAARSMWSVVMEKWPRSDYRQEAIDHEPHTVPVALYRLNMPIPAVDEETRLTFRLYLGPKTPAVFNSRPEYERFDEVMDVDLTPMCFCDIPGARSMARFLLWILRGLHSVIGNWGWAIVGLTILVRSLMVPLNFRMQKSMRKYGAKMAKLKPQLDALQKKHANDRKQLQLAMAQFQREHKMIPPLGGCLPMLLISFPVFIGLFTALRVAYELRCQPFLLYINDLSRPDALFETGWAFQPTFNLLPIIMVALWLVLQMKTPLPTDPQQRQMMKIMRYMPLLFGVMLYNYASGLMVYMITSSLFALLEQKVTRNLLGPPPTEGGVASPMPMI